MMKKIILAGIVMGLICSIGSAADRSDDVPSTGPLKSAGGMEINTVKLVLEERVDDYFLFWSRRLDVTSDTIIKNDRGRDYFIRPCGEGLQVLHYLPGAEYQPHHDYFDPAKAGTPAILKRGGQRVGTVVMYLNTPEQGGATTFPDVALEVGPVKGNVVFFSYNRPHPITRSLHGGSPVIAGEKWVATKWLREGRFE